MIVFNEIIEEVTHFLVVFAVDMLGNSGAPVDPGKGNVFEGFFFLECLIFLT